MDSERVLRGPAKVFAQNCAFKLSVVSEPRTSIDNLEQIGPGLFVRAVILSRMAPCVVDAPLPRHLDRYPDGFGWMDYRVSDNAFCFEINTGYFHLVTSRMPMKKKPPRQLREAWGLEDLRPREGGRRVPQA